MITFQGDIHGQLDRLAPSNGNIIIQVGDMGIGFVSRSEVEDKLNSRDDVQFIRGNHDDPWFCTQCSGYLGDYGVFRGMFFVSGAWSIDKDWRTPGRDWWTEEELSYEQCEAALKLYRETKPEIVFSHDAPSSLFVGGPMNIVGYQQNRTTALLQTMLEDHAPKLWVFGHHHVNRDFVFQRTRFRCLAEFETYEPIIS